MSRTFLWYVCDIFLKPGLQWIFTIRSQLVFLIEKYIFLRYESSYYFANVPMTDFFLRLQQI